MVGFGGVTTSHDDDEHNEHESRRWRGRKGVRGPSWLRMPLLTIGLLGTQIVWSTEMGYASPYLLSLGLSKSWMSMVFVAGPLSGLFVQPLIGVLADHSTSKWGRRRPYMISGSILCAISMLLLGFTKNVVGWILSPDSPAFKGVTIALAVLAIYCIDFTINAVQAVDRALLVDTLPMDLQERGQAWAGRMLSVGSVVGFWVGNRSLTTIFPYLGHTQLQVLCVLTSGLLLIAHFITAISVRERVLLPEGMHQDTTTTTEDGGRPGWRTFAVKHQQKKVGVFSAFKDIWINVKILPPNIRKICMIQFFSWIGWFPVLFFSTVYVGEVYTLQNGTGENKEATAEAATLVGAGALLDSSLLSLGTLILLPAIVGYFKKRSPRRIGFYLGLAEIWIFSLLLFALCMGATLFTSDSVDGSVAVIALTGFCFAVSMWVPFSLLAEQISSDGKASRGGGGAGEGGEYQAIPHDGDESIPMHQQDTRLQDDETPRSGGLVFDAGEESAAVTGGGRQDADERTLVDGDGEERARLLERARRDDLEEEQRLIKDLERTEYATDTPFPDGSAAGGSGGVSQRVAAVAKESIHEKAGIILGIHNVAIVVPQFLVTALSSIIFALYEPVSGVQPGAGHAGAGVGAPAAAAAAVASPTSDDSLFADMDIGFDEKNSRLLARAITRLSSSLVKRTPTHLLPGLIKRLPGSPEDDSANPAGLALIFRIGGACSLIAAVLCWRLAKSLRRQKGR